MTTTNMDNEADKKSVTRVDASKEKESKTARYAPLLSSVRFGPGAITVMLLIVIVTVGLYLLGFVYLAAASGAVAVLLVGVKSMEIIRISRPEARKLLGQRCMVVEGVGRGKTGIVRVYDRSGRLDSELWSAESEHEIPKGKEALVAGMRSIMLLIEPLDTNPSRPSLQYSS